MNHLSKNRTFQFFGGTCQIYVGLGWLGVVGGFANTNSTISIIGGVIFLLTGIASVLFLFKTDEAQGIGESSWPNPSSEVLTLINAGDKIAAIKAYRIQTGAGLKDAKIIVEKHSIVQSVPNA